MFIRVAAAVAVLALAGCITQPTKQQVNLIQEFDSATAQRLIGAGPGSIRGSALIRQQGGGVVTCAGQTVVLIPATGYANERMVHLYGNTGKGYRPPREDHAFNPDPSEYARLVRETTCDAQGYFSFQRVAEGNFFIVTGVTWVIGGIRQGGFLMRNVTVAGPDQIEVVLTP